MRRKLTSIGAGACLRLGLAWPLYLPATGCAPHSFAPNLLLVTIDTLRSDHCSGYGYGRATTPRLDRLARGGTLFENAYAPIPVTGPSHTSLMTGLYPRATGVVQNGFALGDTPMTLAELLRERGYATAAVVSAFPLARRFGLARGFQHYDDEFVRDQASIPDPRWNGAALDQPYDRRGGATTDRALAWLDERPSRRPFFLWVHYFDPHSPYDAPAGDAVPVGAASERPEALIAAYDDEIRFADSQLGRLLDRLDERRLDRDTLVVVTSDHGEGLGQHGVAEHGSVVYEEAVRVPLVFRWRGVLPTGQRRTEAAELIDVFPTVVELLSAQGASATTQGESLAAQLHGQPHGGQPDRPVFLQREFSGRAGDNLFAARIDNDKYVETREGSRVARRELYDLNADPKELRSLDLQFNEAGRSLAWSVRRWRSQVKLGRPQQVAPENLEVLRALGYAR